MRHVGGGGGFDFGAKLAYGIIEGDVGGGDKMFDDGLGEFDAWGDGFAVAAGAFEDAAEKPHGQGET